MTAALFGVGLSLWFLLPPATPVVLSPWLTVPLLLTAFLLVEWYPLTLEFRGESFHTTLSGPVAILGVVFAGRAPPQAKA